MLQSVTGLIKFANAIKLDKYNKMVNFGNNCTKVITLFSISIHFPFVEKFKMSSFSLYRHHTKFNI